MNQRETRRQTMNMTQRRSRSLHMVISVMKKIKLRSVIKGGYLRGSSLGRNLQRGVI